MTENEKKSGLLAVVLTNAAIQEHVAMIAFNKKVFAEEPTQENMDALYVSLQHYYKAVNVRCKELGLKPLYKI